MITMTPTKQNMRSKIFNLGNTEIAVWQERDRLQITLVAKASGKTLAQWTDSTAHEAIEDGFLDTKEARLGTLDRFVRQGGPLHASALSLYTGAPAA